MLSESRRLHHNKQYIQAGEESSWLIYGAARHTSDNSYLPVRVTDICPKDHMPKKFWTIVFLFYLLQLSHLSFRKISESECDMEKKKTSNADC